MSKITINSAFAAVVCAASLAGLPAMAGAQGANGIRVLEASADSYPYSQWQCARLPVQTRMLGRLMEVVVGGESRILMQAMSASGARYVAPGDPGTGFWGKGGVATVSWSGTELPTCTEGGALATPFRASGNEPFWAVDFDGWRLFFSEPGQPAREFQISQQVARAGGLTLQAAAGADTLRLDLSEGVCRDSMSGMSRPYSATLAMNEKTLQGCGGDPARLLQGARWLLQSTGGQAVTVHAWVEFLPDARLAGSNGCNRLIGSYAISGEGMTFSQLGSTRMACSPDLMTQSDLIDRHLATVRGFSFNEQGALVLSTDHGDVVAVDRGDE